MTRAAAARWRAIARMVPPDLLPVVDVGADHGRVAELTGAIATERAPRRAGRANVPWVIADGLTPFRQVGVAIVAGMGAQRIARILREGPTPVCAIVHAPDDPPTLRGLLARQGWQIDAEDAVAEGPRVAEIVRLYRGVERHEGATLRWGPWLARRRREPLLREHFRRQHDRLRAIEPHLRTADPARHRQVVEDLAHLHALADPAPPAMR